MLPVAAFLQRVVQRAPENGEDVCGGDLPLLLEIVEHLGGGGDQTGVDFVADDLGMVHQLPGLCLGHDEVFVQKVAAHQAVAIHALIAEFGDNADLVPIRNHVRFLLKKEPAVRFLGAVGP